MVSNSYRWGRQFLQLGPTLTDMPTGDRLTLSRTNSRRVTTQSKERLSILRSIKYGRSRLDNVTTNQLTRQMMIFIIISCLKQFAEPTYASTQPDGGSRRQDDSMTLPLSSKFASQRHIYPSSRQLETSSSRDRLSKLQSRLFDLRRQIEREIAADNSNLDRQPALGSPCLNSKDCQLAIKGSHCNLDTYTCSCMPHHVELNSTFCLPPVLLGFECLQDAQCQVKVTNSRCSRTKRVCECNDNLFTYRNNKCLPASKINDYCLSDRQCQLADWHSHCKWKIPQVYGLCKCPPNYKQHLSNDQSTIKCVPRLGDSCLDTHECLLATENSQCRLWTNSTDQLNLSWPSSGISNSRCLCKPGFKSSADRLHCVGLPTTTALPASTMAIQSELTLSAVQSMDVKHQYELVIPTDAPQAITTSTPSEATILADRTIPAMGTTKRPTEVRMSSLGKSCSSRAECQARDRYSDCISGICECIRPTTSCSANSTGCHRDAFQCRNGQCISWYFVCDRFKNCDDGSDEDQCQAWGCPSEAFQCDDGACLARGKLCNGQRDCSDGSDENHCSTLPNGLNSSSRPGALLTASQQQTCHPRAFRCSNGQCLPAYVFCNAVEDCADGSDEQEKFCERQNNRLAANMKWSQHLNSSQLPNRDTPTLAPNLDKSLATKVDEAKKQLLFKADQINSKAATLAPTASKVANTRLPSLTNNLQPPARAASGKPESPLIKSDRVAINKLLASLNLAPRTPESRGRKRWTRQIEQPLGTRRKSSQRSAEATNHEANSNNQDEQHLTATVDECPLESFTCLNGKCRSSAILCSGVDGCGDNSDEDRCEVCQCAAP